MKQRFTLEDIRSAFRLLEEHVAAQGADTNCIWAIRRAAEDGIGILTGELKPEDDAPAGDELRRVALAARTEAAFDAAALRLLGALEDRERVAALRRELDPAWKPSPAGNEEMLWGLEAYSEKLAGALGRGAARAEAETFALREARRVYWRVIKG